MLRIVWNSIEANEIYERSKRYEANDILLVVKYNEYDFLNKQQISKQIIYKEIFFHVHNST